MNKLKCIIVDDEANARAALRGVITNYFSKRIEILDEARDLPGAVKLINKFNPDIVFLDIEMPGYNGLELPDFFNDDQIDFHIIFVTAYAEYAIRAFKLSAVDYLLKPVKPEAIEEALKIYEQRLNEVKRLKGNSLEVFRDNLAGNKNLRIVLPTSEGQFIVDLQNILYIKADGSYVHFYLVNKEKIVLAKKLLDFEFLENYGHFLRVHRSYIVNTKCINLIIKGEGGLLLNDGTEIPITPDKKSELLKLIDIKK